MNINFPRKLQFLFKPSRYKVLYGGRGGAKSWGVARALIALANKDQIRILCAREFQKSIKQSVHQLLSDQIDALGLSGRFEILANEIRCINGSQFYFTGLAEHTVDSIKSYEGIDVCWVEEAQTVSKRSWDILIPTIRKDNSEIWITLNPHLDSDETYIRFIQNTPPDCQRVKINYNDNPFFPAVLEQERLHCKAVDPKNYPNIWEGAAKTVVEGAIYADEYLKLIEDGRLTTVKHDHLLKAHAVWDLGWNDSTAILIAQRSGSEVRIIDYIEDSHKTLAHYSAVLKEKPYNWGQMFLPHDSVSKDLKTGQSAYDMLKAMGWDVAEPMPIGSVEGGISKARMMFEHVWMDRENTKRLQECIKRYRRVIPKYSMEPAQPLHDEYSHGADTVRYLAIAVSEFRNENIKTRRRAITHAAQGNNAWMSY